MILAEDFNAWIKEQTDERLWSVLDSLWGTHSALHGELGAGPGELVGRCFACDSQEVIENELERRGNIYRRA